MKGPVTKNPWVSPISTPLSTGATPVLYAGRFDKKLATIGAEVTGVSIMPMKGSPLIGLTTWFFASALATTTPLTPALSCFCFDTVLDTAILGLVLGDKAKPFPWPKPRTQLADRTVILQVNVSVCSSKCVGMLLRMRLLLTSLSLSLSLSLSFFSKAPRHSSLFSDDNGALFFFFFFLSFFSFIFVFLSSYWSSSSSYLLMRSLANRFHSISFMRKCVIDCKCTVYYRIFRQCRKRRLESLQVPQKREKKKKNTM